MSEPVRVGLISDTHGLFRPEVADLFAGVSFIVHAGDVGRMGVLDALARLAPVEAVFGNVDDVHDPRLAPARLLPVGQLTLHVSHGHEFARPRPELLVSAYRADVIVFGHTHRAIVTTLTRDDRQVLVVNPGAAGPRRFDVRPSVAILTVCGTDAEARVIELD